jgi:hypothetical protein
VCSIRTRPIAISKSATPSSSRTSTRLLSPRCTKIVRDSPVRAALIVSRTTPCGKYISDRAAICPGVRIATKSIRGTKHAWGLKALTTLECATGATSHRLDASARVGFHLRITHHSRRASSSPHSVLTFTRRNNKPQQPPSVQGRRRVR